MRLTRTISGALECRCNSGRFCCAAFATWMICSVHGWRQVFVVAGLLRIGMANVLLLMRTKMEGWRVRYWRKFFFSWSRRRSKRFCEPRRRLQLPLRYTKNLEMVRCFLEESGADKENTSRLQWSTFGPREVCHLLEFDFLIKLFCVLFSLLPGEVDGSWPEGNGAICQLRGADIKTD